MEELIAKRYAKALSAVSKNVSAIAQELTTLSSVLSMRDVQTALTSPIIQNEKKTEMVLDSLGDEADVTLVNFIKILGENNRLDIIPAIAKVLNTDLQRVTNVYEGVLSSKEILDQTALSNLEEALKKYTGSTIKLRQKISELDGLHVAVNDLGIEVNFSKQRVKEQLIDFITKSL